jgi:hypothetical protein
MKIETRHGVAIPLVILEDNGQIEIVLELIE